MSHPMHLAQLLAWLDRADRICPNPIKWQEFWKLIGSPPRLMPLILTGWAFSSDHEKRERFKEQIRYAESQGKLDQARAFLVALKEDDWHTYQGGSLHGCPGDSMVDEWKW